MADSQARFQEANLRTERIRDLGLSIEGTRLEPVIDEFQAEIAALPLAHLTPTFYLSTEWGVVFGSQSIALPFYLARPELEAIQVEQVGHLEGAGRTEILRYLRHEFGHVVNYAWHLFEMEEWVRHFGSITQPYLEEYNPKPFSRRFVRHLPGWYAQKHPDEDWAETFAVWMTPKKDWRKTYRTWPTALAKLEYCDRLLATLRDKPLLEVAQERDQEVGELAISLQEYYSKLDKSEDGLPPGLEGALTAIFEDFGAPESESTVARKPAAALLKNMERELVANVYLWTGHFPERTRALVRHLATRAEELQQVYPADQEATLSIAITTFVTALAMNHVHRGTYLP
ncbi:MAG TPA: putative zinc-binding metallopeptidase [Planctomycetota bacterium]|nr:putative zinc-binding metallopeptidase [Planctomycetota bacterium]